MVVTAVRILQRRQMHDVGNTRAGRTHRRRIRDVTPNEAGTFELGLVEQQRRAAVPGRDVERECGASRSANAARGRRSG
jgi:hypothetical protein